MWTGGVHTPPYPAMDRRRLPPWTAIPAVRSPLNVAKTRFAIVVGLLLTSSLAGVLSAVAWMSHGQDGPTLAEVTPAAQGYAAMVAEAWVSGSESPVPVADGIPFRLGGGGKRLGLGDAVITPQSWVRKQVTGRQIEQHTFLVSAGSGVYQLVVTLDVAASPPTLVAYPALMPVPPGGAAPPQPLDYRDVPQRIQPEEVPGQVRERVAQWLAAYAADDREALRDIARDDTAPLERYAGLGGLELSGTPQITVAIPTVQGLVLRVRAEFRAPDGGSVTGEYDLLVTEPYTPVPRVVDWGPAGSGPGLAPRG